MKTTVTVTALLLAGSLCAQANLLQNASFETAGTDATKAQYWQWENPDQNGSVWGTASREQWRAHSGTYEAALAGSWAGDTQGGWWQQAAAEPGVTYTASAWFWADDGWTAVDQGIKIEFYDATLTTPIHTVTNQISGISTNWQQETVQAVAPQDAAYVRVVIYVWGVGANGALQFDDVELIAEPGTVIIISDLWNPESHKQYKSGAHTACLEGRALRDRAATVSYDSIWHCGVAELRPPEVEHSDSRTA
jgi:hypothetical protein